MFAELCRKGIKKKYFSSSCDFMLSFISTAYNYMENLIFDFPFVRPGEPNW